MMLVGWNLARIMAERMMNTVLLVLWRYTCDFQRSVHFSLKRKHLIELLKNFFQLKSSIRVQFCIHKQNLTDLC